MARSNAIQPNDTCGVRPVNRYVEMAITQNAPVMRYLGWSTLLRRPAMTTVTRAQRPPGAWPLPGRRLHFFSDPRTLNHNCSRRQVSAPAGKPEVRYGAFNIATPGSNGLAGNICGRAWSYHARIFGLNHRLCGVSGGNFRGGNRAIIYARQVGAGTPDLAL
jgi:hypothetical protein